MTRASRLLQVYAGGGDSGRVICIRCRLNIGFEEADIQVVADLLASHWHDDHHSPGWQDAAAEARDRLWRKNPELLEQLAALSGGEAHPSTG